VTDGEDSAVEAVQMASGDGTVNCASRIAQRTRQLPDGDDAMLPFGQIRKGVRVD
jgi:diacylglycerol kinase family enzyme